MKFATVAVALSSASLAVAAPPGPPAPPKAPGPPKPPGPPGPPGPPHHHPAPDCGLNDLAKKAGLLYFGTAIDNPSLNNSRYLSIAYDRHEFGQVTPANGQKWMYIEPERNVFNYTLADQIIKPAIKHGQLRRCHNLVWHSQLPDWLTSQNWTKPELLSILENHIAHEMTYFKGQCYAWDVVNEGFNEDGTLREDLWLDTLGPDYMATVFQIANKYDKHAKLYYNDYNIETIGNKSNSVRAMVKDFKKRGIRIDGVGLQSHFVAGQTPSYEEQSANIKAYNDLGVEVALTELDVRMYFPENPANDTLQAQDYATSVKACKDAKKCVGVTVWDFYDPYTWILTAGDYFAGQGAADIYWANYTKKPAWHAIANVLAN